MTTTTSTDDVDAEGLRENRWRAIETAPRDGTAVLVWLSVEKQVAVRSAHSADRVIDGLGPRGWDFPSDATHWQSLPPAPGAPSPDLEHLQAKVAELRERLEKAERNRMQLFTLAYGYEQALTKIAANGSCPNGDVHLQTLARAALKDMDNG